MAVKHFRSFAREWAMQFLFQHDIALAENVEESIDIFISQMKDDEVSTEIPDKKTSIKTEKALKSIIAGILANIEKIDAVISKYSPKWSINRMDIVDRNIMRIAVYEMLFCNNVPPIVSINEAVELAKIYGSDNTPSFVNGILNTVMNTLDRPLREAACEE